mgnify:CR=1 FL=1
MRLKKEAAKWFAVLLLLSVCALSYVIYYAVYMSKQKEAQGGETTPDTFSPAPVVSELPRYATAFENLIIQHTGGSGDDTHLATHFIAGKFYTLTLGGSNDYDFEGKGIYLSVFDGSKLNSVIKVGGDGEIYLNSKITGEGIAVATKNGDKALLRIVEYTLTVTPAIEMDLDNLKMYLDQNMLFIYGSKQSRLHLYVYGGKTVSEIDCIPTPEPTTIIEIFKNSSGIYAIVGGSQIGYVYCYSDRLNLVAKIPSVVISVAVNSDGQICLLCKDSSGISLNVVNSSGQIGKKPLDGGSVGRLFKTQTGFLAVTDAAVHYLDSKFSLITSIEMSMTFDKITGALDGKGQMILLFTDTAKKITYIKRLNSYSKLNDIGVISTSSGNINLYLSGEELNIFFTSDINDGIYSGNFGGSDVYFINILPSLT